MSHGKKDKRKPGQMKDYTLTTESNKSKLNNYFIKSIPFKGELLKPCPGTKGYICCGYQILNIGANCPLDCSYCILQSYFKDGGLRVFSNLEERIGEVITVIESTPERIYRIGTGEFTDSLALDPLTKWTSLLIPLFAERKNLILELKTKTTSIKGLIDSRHRRGIIVSWSLNSPFISERDESKSPSIKARLMAARKCQQEGFSLGFHFDPLVTHRGWQDQYLRTLELLAQYINPKAIVWISMGSFRYMPELKPIIRKRHPDTRILDGEFIMGLDGKMRYFKPIRIELYSYMRHHFESWDKDLGLYLCMESNEVWQQSMGWSPGKTEMLSDYLDARVRKFFG
ncbi:MAG: DNA photolyase [Desulfobacteraceae bacterium]|nr:MAG: DNA photolyase [Desulfobacteraceae bacterium]